MSAGHKRKAKKQMVFNRYVKAPLETEVRLDTVIVADNGDFIYNYVQTINTRPKLRKVGILLGGEIFQQSTLLYTIPETDDALLSQASHDMNRILTSYRREQNRKP